MHSMMVIGIMAGAVSLALVIQALVFLWLIAQGRNLLKDLLNRLAARDLSEYARATKALEAENQAGSPAAVDDLGTPIFS